MGWFEREQQLRWHAAPRSSATRRIQRAYQSSHHALPSWGSSASSAVIASLPSAPTSSTRREPSADVTTALLVMLPPSQHSWVKPSEAESTWRNMHSADSSESACRVPSESGRGCQSRTVQSALAVANAPGMPRARAAAGGIHAHPPASASWPEYTATCTPGPSLGLSTAEGLSTGSENSSAASAAAAATSNGAEGIRTSQTRASPPSPLTPREDVRMCRPLGWISMLSGKYTYPTRAAAVVHMCIVPVVATAADGDRTSQRRTRRSSDPCAMRARPMVDPGKSLTHVAVLRDADARPDGAIPRSTSQRRTNVSFEAVTTSRASALMSTPLTRSLFTASAEATSSRPSAELPAASPGELSRHTVMALPGLDAAQTGTVAPNAAAVQFDAERPPRRASPSRLAVAASYHARVPLLPPARKVVPGPLRHQQKPISTQRSAQACERAASGKRRSAPASPCRLCSRCQ